MTKRIAFIIAGILFVSILITGIVLAQSTTWQGTRWEYGIAYVIAGQAKATVFELPDPDEQAAMNDAITVDLQGLAAPPLRLMGDNGWELVYGSFQVGAQNTGLSTFYFKRPKQS